MAAPKYLIRDVVTGNIKEVFATEVGGVAEQIVSTGPGGTISPSFLPASNAATAIAGENLNAGAYVYIKTSDGKLYNAVWSSGGNQAIGFVLLSYTTGQVATYYDAGQNTSQSGLTVGVRQYGDPTTAGAVTSTVPTGAGVLAQLLGYSASATAIQSQILDAIILAS